MAKRLTDTDKWKDEWYVPLSNDYRTIWQYLLDNCNHAGIFKKSFGLMNFLCHTKIEEKEFNEVFKNRVVDCGDFYFVPRFITFQYIDLCSNKPVVLSVIKELDRNGLLEMVRELLPNDYKIIKSKSKSIVKSIDKSKSIEIPFTTIPPKDFKECVR